MNRHAAVWVGVVVGLLLLDVLVQGTMLVCALGDPSFAVESNYEWKAEHWNEIQREREKSAALDWTVDLSATPLAIPGQVAVEIAIADRAGVPVADATVDVDAFHNARAGEIHALRLAEVAAGRYRDAAMLARPGVWEFRVTVVRGAERYVGRFRESLGGVPRDAR